MLPTTLYLTGAHRALADVEAMKAVLTHPSLVHCLSDLPTHSSSQQLKLWDTQKKLHQRTTHLVSSLGKPSVTAAQAKKLDSVGFTYAGLVSLRSEVKDEGDFSTQLKAKGINSKALRAKLWQLLGSQR